MMTQADISVEPIKYNQYYIVDVDVAKVLSGGYATEAEAEEAARNLYGDDWYAIETPYSVWQGSNIMMYKFK
jgi:hypothetical protein